MDVAKAGACVQDFEGTLSAIARNLRIGLLESMGRSAASSAKERQELEMCWRRERVSKRSGCAAVIGTRTEGSKRFGHRLIVLFLSLTLIKLACSAHACQRVRRHKAP